MLSSPMVFARRRFASPGYTLMILGVGHAAWGLLAHGEPLREIFRAGVVRSGFPVAVPLGYWLLRRSRALRSSDHGLSPASRAAGTA